MALVPKNYLAVETIRDVKFNLKASCSICTEAFDTNIHIPKVLVCGHSFCKKCIESILNAVQVSYSGNGEVNTAFTCPICRDSMSVPTSGASGFPNNHQLLDAIAPQDSRYMTCISCKMNGSEASFHICRECIIESHGFDVHTMIDVEPPIHPDSFTVCSTCVLKSHNTQGHTVIEYAPIRLDYEFKRNKMSVDVLKSQMVEKFADVRRILSTMPMLVEKKEAEVNKIVDLMQRAKNRQNQDIIFEKYKHEMNAIIKILDILNKDGGKLNEMVSEKVKILEKNNEEINAQHCFKELPNLKEVLKIPEVLPVSRPEEVPERPHRHQTSLQEEPQQAAPKSNNPPIPEVQVQPFHEQNEQSIGIIGTYSNDENFWMILVSIWESMYFGINQLYRILSRGTTNVFNTNNYNQEHININPSGFALLIIIILISILYKFMF